VYPVYIVETCAIRCIEKFVSFPQHFYNIVSFCCNLHASWTILGKMLEFGRGSAMLTFNYAVNYTSLWYSKYISHSVEFVGIF
jgi:hypothetical protein